MAKEDIAFGAAIRAGRGPNGGSRRGAAAIHLLPVFVVTVLT